MASSTRSSACHVGTATAGSPGAGRSWWSPPGTTSARSARAGSAATWTRCCSPDSWRPLVRRHRCADLHVIHDADGLGAEAVEHETRRLVDRIAGIDAEPSQPYRRLRDGDYPAQLRALHPDLAPGRT